MNYEVEEKVDRLEALLGQFIVQTNTALTRLERGLEAFKIEMRDFKNEMRDFKNEMKDFKNEMKDFKNDSLNFKKDMNKKWGEMAHRLGTLVEDLSFPSFPRILREKFGLDTEDIMIRRKRKLPQLGRREFDLIAISKGLVFLNSTKSTLRIIDVDTFADDIRQFWQYFPEYQSHELIGVLATLSVEESVLTYAEKNGYLVLAIGEELMEIKNRSDFEPRRWRYQETA